MGDEEILRLSHQGYNASQGSPHRGMHHKIAQKSPIIFQIPMVSLSGFNTGGGILIETGFFRREKAVVYVVKTIGYRNHHGYNRQCIEECGKECSRGAKEQGEQDLRPDCEKNPGKHVLKKLFHEVDSGYHEHEKKDYRKIARDFVVHGNRRRHAQKNGFKCKQTGWRKRIALERHCQSEYEFRNQRPTRNEWPCGPHEHGVHGEKSY